MLKGLTLAITSGLCGEHPSGGSGSEDDQSDNETTKDEFSFTEMKNLLSSVGAASAPTVHKRVDFLVCSQAAYERNTQKVRKAKKLGVKVVDVQYLIKCKEAGKKLPIGNFVLYEPEVKAMPDPKKPEKSEPQEASKNEPKKRKGSEESKSSSDPGKAKIAEKSIKKQKSAEVGKSVPKSPKEGKPKDEERKSTKTSGKHVNAKSENAEKPETKPSKVEGNDNPIVVPGTNAGPKKKSTSNQRKRDRKRAMKAAKLAAKGIAGDVLEKAAKKKVQKSPKEKKGGESKTVNLVAKSRPKKQQNDHTH